MELWKQTTFGATSPVVLGEADEAGTDVAELSDVPAVFDGELRSPLRADFVLAVGPDT